MSMGSRRFMFALTSIKGIGRRLDNIVYKKADVNMNKRFVYSLAAELENLMVIVANLRQFRIPDWFLNRQKDYKDGRYSQVISNAPDMKLEGWLKKIRNHRCLRHYWVYVDMGSTQRPLDDGARLLVSSTTNELSRDDCFGFHFWLHVYGSCEGVLILP